MSVVISDEIVRASQMSETELIREKVMLSDRVVIQPPNKPPSRPVL